MNEPLPIRAIHRELLAAIGSSPAVIVRAPTGSGKSTQIPQMLRDESRGDGQILVLEPRRLAARMLAMRVAAERDVAIGDEIGYQTRFENAISARTRIRFITEGILSRLLLSDPDLRGIDTILFDEFHERGIAADLGLGLARGLQQRRPELRLVVMSATLETQALQSYLPRATLLESEGSLHPVDIRYRGGSKRTPVWEHAAQAARDLIQQGAKGDILVFMPGAYEIRRTIDSMRTAITGRVRLAPLYGDLDARRQREVMHPAPDRRTIIVATNIAETSLTIPGVRHVIDSGLARIHRFDPARGFNTLFVEPISEDAARQRAGRAGREAPGICIRLWSAAEHSARPRRTSPEVCRVDLSETVLQLHQLGFANPRDFPWYESPKPAALDAAESLLADLGALDKDAGRLTDLGRRMCAFPMHPRLSRLLIEATRRGAPRQGALAAAILTERLPASGKPLRLAGSASSGALSSDVFAVSDLIDQARAANFHPQTCAALQVNASAARQTLRTAALFLHLCRKQGLHTRSTGDRSEALARAMLAAYPDHLARRKDAGTLLCDMRENRCGELDKNSAARRAKLLVAASIRETRTRKGMRIMLSLATEIHEHWLQEMFPDQVRIEQRHVWNSARRAVEMIEQRWRLGVLMEQRRHTTVDLAQADDILADAIIRHDLPLAGWDTAVVELINRIQWLRDRYPQMRFPAFDDSDRRLIVHALCTGEYQYDRVRTKPAAPLVLELLSWEQRRCLDTHAPAVMHLPSGRKMRIRYAAGQPPKGRARIQDLYGCLETPRIAEGRIPVLLEILAPNMRAVQLTDDLSGFWSNHYPRLRAGLARRYPKHEWR
jgi:ATP-dependent helicase HrpB